MSIFLKILCLFLLTASWVKAVDYIADQDQRRMTAFDARRDESDARPFTQAINTRLTDHSKIDYRLTATDDQKGVIYRAVVGEAIIHGRTSLAPSTTVSDPRYQRHCQALAVVAESAVFLWQAVSRGTYFYRFDDCAVDLQRMSSAKGFDYRALLTVHFFHWFYQALGAYRHELNFFGGTATVPWLQAVAERYGAGHVVRRDIRRADGTKVVHQYVYDELGAMIAVIKPQTADQRSSGEKPDWVIWQLAQAAGLQGVVNPAIPARLGGGKPTVTTTNPTSIVESFVGVAGSNNGKVFQTSSAEINALLADVIGSSAAREATSRLGLTTPGSFSSYILTLKDLAHYLEAKYQGGSSTDPYQRFNALQVFNRAIRIENLVQLIAFWYLIELRDMHAGNLLLSVNPQGEWVITCIDYNLCFPRADSPASQYPPLSALRQASEPLPAAATARITAISAARLARVHAGCLAAGSEVPLSRLHGNLDSLKKAVAKGQPTIRSLMHTVYLKTNNPTECDRQERLNLLSSLPPATTAFDLLLVKPYGSQNPERTAQSTGYPTMTGIPGYQAVDSSVYNRPSAKLGIEV